MISPKPSAQAWLLACLLVLAALLTGFLLVAGDAMERDVMRQQTPHGSGGEQQTEPVKVPVDAPTPAQPVRPLQVMARL